MSTPLAPRLSWRRHRWIWAVALTYAVQVALIWLLSDPRPVSVRLVRPSPPLSLVAAAADDARLDDTLTIADPTAFALANRRGFSGGVWRALPRPQPQLTDWQEPNSWLTPRLDRWARDFQDFVRSNAGPAVMVADKPPGKVAQISIGTDGQPARSRLRIEGGLARRTLQKPLDLPAWPAAEWLTNTVVQLAVNAAGEPVSVVVVEHSGSREADERAEALAWAARFQPLPGSTLPPPLSLSPRTWGELVFQWQVQGIQPWPPTR